MLQKTSRTKDQVVTGAPTLPTSARLLVVSLSLFVIPRLPLTFSLLFAHPFRPCVLFFLRFSEVSKRGWRKGGCRHKMSQIHFLTTTGRSGSKRHLDEAVWVTTALVFGCCARLEHDMCITLRRITSSDRCLRATDFDPRRKAQRVLLSMLPKAPAVPKIDEQTVKMRFCYSKGCLWRWGHIGVKRT